MSIALESSRGMREIEPSRYKCLVKSPIFDSLPVDSAEDECSSSASSTTSSIGKNSDGESSDGETCEDNEVQSAFKGTLNSMDSLEEALPMRRGISKFYNGKSKSFTSLVEATSSSSIKEIAKPENAYTRKRRNLLAFSHVWDKSRISKRPISSSKSTLALAVAMSSSESISSASEDSSSSLNSNSNSKSPPHLLPPLYPRSRPSTPQSFGHWRSFSVADLQHCDKITN